MILLLIALTACASPLQAAPQQNENPNQSYKPSADKSTAQQRTFIPPIDPSPYTGAELRKSTQDAMDIQRNVATSTARLAEDTRRLADDTHTLVWVGSVVGGLEVLIFVGQLFVMGVTWRANSSARLYIDGATAANFHPGKEPHFFLRITNAGQVAAEQVRVFLEIAYQQGGVKPKAEGNVIFIPANGYREYDFRANFVLPNTWAEVNDMDIQIRGKVTYKGKPQAYCYKYNQWSGHNRPDGVPLFVPCDFDPRRSVTVVAKAGHITLTAHPASIEVTKPPTEPV